MLSLKSSSNNLGFKIEEAIKIKQGKGINAFNPLTLSKERNFLKINNILYIVITNFVYRIILTENGELYKSTTRFTFSCVRNELNCV